MSESTDVPGEQTAAADSEGVALAPHDSAPLPTPPTPRRRWTGLIVLLAVVLAAAAAVLAAAAWLKEDALYAALERGDASAGSALAAVRGELTAVRGELAQSTERLAALETALAAERDQRAALAERLAPFPGRLGALEQRVARAQGGTVAARGEWLRAEAEYDLMLASSELTLGGHWQTATAALERADAVLAELADPAFDPVREAISAELVALKAVSLPDVPGLAFTLARLEQRVATLPQRPVPSADAPAAAAPGDAPAGFGRLWAQIKGALAGMIRVERTDAPVAELMSAEERRLARRQVEVELKIARLALLGGDAGSFAASLDVAIALLGREFDASAADVAAAIETLTEMRAVEIAPARPDLSTSLRRLRATRIEGD